MKIFTHKGHYKQYLSFFFLLVFKLSCHSAFAQMDTFPTLQLKTVEVSAPKIKKPWLKSSYTIYNLVPTMLDQLPQNSLQELLITTPGVFTLNANNQAQDLRISIRGFGSRAAFGVRGVKIVVDGIPETTADGQGQLDNINLGIIQRIEVLENGAAALYGNASGGVLNITTLDDVAFIDKNSFLKIGSGFQSFNGQQYQFTIGKKIKKTSLILHGNHQKGAGYRQHAAYQSTNLNLRLTQQLSSKNKIEAILNFLNSPTAEDAGGVDSLSFEEMPRAARDRNVQFNAGEAIQQGKGSLRYTHQIGKAAELETYAFYTRRNYDGQLPFTNGGTIKLNRDFYGQGSSFSSKKEWRNLDWQYHLGYEIQAQRDARTRLDNNDGMPGDITLLQKEQFTNAGIFLLNDFNYKKWIFNTSIRYDLNNIQVQDQLLTNGDDSGTIDLNAWNYSFGVAYSLSPSKQLFARWSTSFETPTLNELSNNPDGSGFNPSLQAQSAIHYETGIKGFIKNATTIQLSAFYIDSKNEILPYEIAAFPGRNFYRNTGATKRLGLEIYLKQDFNKKIYLTANGSFHKFTFSDYVIDGKSFNGNRLPGLPFFRGALTLDWKIIKKLDLNIQHQTLSRIFTNNENNSFQRSIQLTNISLKYIIKKNRFWWSPYFGVQNIFRTEHADNIRINAFGERYYEAAPRGMIYGGVRMGW